MKIIITGATGFVGTSLVKHFNEKGTVDVITLNLRDPQYSLVEATALIHLAGKAHDVRNVSDPQEYFDVNYGKTKELFDLFLQSAVRDFVYFSSVKAVADTVTGSLTEDVKGEPKTPYGQSKLMAEEYLLAKTLPEGKRLIIIRPCMIHGPGNKGNLNLLYKVVKKGIPYPLGAFENKRSFLSIANLIYALENFIKDSKIPGGIYNLADDEPLSTNRLIKIIAEGSNTRGTIWTIPAGLVSGLARIGDLLRLPLNSERLMKLTESYVVSNSKIKKALEIDKFLVSSTDGLLTTIRSFDRTGSSVNQ